MFNAIKARVQSFIRDQEGVVAWEYLLVIAGVTVAVIAAVALGANPLIQTVIDATCDAVGTIMPTTVTMGC